MAFAGNRSELTERMDVSHGLLEALLCRNIINSRHYQLIQVCVIIFYNVCYLNVNGSILCAFIY